MRKLFYPARAGLRVPKPGGGFLRAEGERVIYQGPHINWWNQRERDGDAVTELPSHLEDVAAEPESEPEKAPPETKKTRARRAKTTPDTADEATE